MTQPDDGGWARPLGDQWRGRSSACDPLSDQSRPSSPESPENQDSPGKPDHPDSSACPPATAPSISSVPPGYPAAFPFFLPRGRTPRSGGLPTLLTVVLLVGALGGAGGAAILLELDRNQVHDGGFVLPSTQVTGTARAAGSVAGVAARLLPSVVALRIRNGTEGGTGSGFVIDSRAGYILTNNHVVSVAEGGGTIQVIFQDGGHTAGTVVGRDPSYDLAVVKADVGGRAALTLGNSDDVVVGDTTIAIGAPLGLQGTVTTGIVSALNRPVAAGGSDEMAFINAIQTDAAINPGNSGGPLVDIRGAVIGINSAIARAPGTGGSGAGNIGLGFTIPSNQARRTAQQLIRTGQAEHPVIGVLLDDDYEGEGVRVSTRDAKGQKPVTPGGPADKAGIKPGDVILKLEDRPMTTPDELVVAIRARTPGETVKLLVRRSGDEREIKVQLIASNK
jgi:putative serine protease PepD